MQFSKLFHLADNETFVEMGFFCGPDHVNSGWLKWELGDIISFCVLGKNITVIKENLISMWWENIALLRCVQLNNVNMSAGLFIALEVSVVRIIIKEDKELFAQLVLATES